MVTGRTPYATALDVMPFARACALESAHAYAFACYERAVRDCWERITRAILGADASGR